MSKKNLKKASVTATMNVDFFSASRTLSDRVSEYMRCVVMKKDINLQYSAKIETLKASIENLEKLNGSIMEEQIPALKAAAFDQISVYEAEKKKALEEQAKFTYTDEDNAFKKAIKADSSTDNVMREVCKWFANYNLNVENTYFLEEVLNSFGSKFSFKKFVGSNGVETLDIDAGTALKNMYNCAYTHMVTVGTIKAAAIPELVRKQYMPKPKKTEKGKKNSAGKEKVKEDTKKAIATEKFGDTSEKADIIDIKKISA